MMALWWLCQKAVSCRLITRLTAPGVCRCRRERWARFPVAIHVSASPPRGLHFDPTHVGSRPPALLPHLGCVDQLLSRGGKRSVEGIRRSCRRSTSRLDRACRALRDAAQALSCLGQRLLCTAAERAGQGQGCSQAHPARRRRRCCRCWPPKQPAGSCSALNALTPQLRRACAAQHGSWSSWRCFCFQLASCGKPWADPASHSLSASVEGGANRRSPPSSLNSRVAAQHGQVGSQEDLCLH